MDIMYVNVHNRNKMIEKEWKHIALKCLFEIMLRPKATYGLRRFVNDKCAFDTHFDVLVAADEHSITIQRHKWIDLYILVILDILLLIHLDSLI